MPMLQDHESTRRTALRNLHLRSPACKRPSRAKPTRSQQGRVFNENAGKFTLPSQEQKNRGIGWPTLLPGTLRPFLRLALNDASAYWSNERQSLAIGNNITKHRCETLRVVFPKLHFESFQNGTFCRDHLTSSACKQVAVDGECMQSTFVIWCWPHQRKTRIPLVVHTLGYKTGCNNCLVNFCSRSRTFKRWAVQSEEKTNRLPSWKGAPLTSGRHRMWCGTHLHGDGAYRRHHFQSQSQAN
mmetsp:Transcript_44106/g.122121  ORF Transcript_44106/g.122121 Transcript_44106/m.122121 type:complete len:242 (+) Transcript_44106:1156-1881(+)